jgi:hypothetical protein
MGTSSLGIHPRICQICLSGSPVGGHRKPDSATHTQFTNEIRDKR